MLLRIGSAAHGADDAANAASKPATRGVIAAEYAKRFNSLAPDDNAGHYALAEWCQQQRRFDLVTRQCQHILKRKPDHTNAKILLELARQESAKRRGRRGPHAPADAPGTTRSARRAQLVSDADIQELRFAELQRRRPERVQVRFKNDLCKRFAEDMVRDGRFSRDDRITFLRMKPALRLALIVDQTGDALKQDIEIRSDPMIFRVFRKRVLPTVMNGCGTAMCHGGVKAPVFRLYNDAALSEEAMYTNFLVLEGLKVGERPLIDRDRPDESVLLQYLLPRDLARHRHSTEVDPAVRSKDDPTYVGITQWIARLRFPHFGYDVSWRPPEQPKGNRAGAGPR